MPMVKHGIELDSEAIRDFCRRWKVRELSVFGSILRDDFRPDSDVDFLIEWMDDTEWDLFDLVHMQRNLKKIVGRPVDLLTRYSVEHDPSIAFRQSVLSGTERIYAPRRR